MEKTTQQVRLRFWHFVCPECGFGDQEVGTLAAVGEIHCEICLTEDEPRRIVVRRWLVEDDPAPVS